MHLENAIDTGYDLYEIFDSCEYAFRQGITVFEITDEDFKSAIQKHFNAHIIG